MKKTVFYLTAAAAGLLWYTTAGDRQALAEVQSGNAALVCELVTGTQQVEKSSVLSFDGERWFFKNGSAKNCLVIR